MNLLPKPPLRILIRLSILTVLALALSGLFAVGVLERRLQFLGSGFLGREFGVVGGFFFEEAEEGGGGDCEGGGGWHGVWVFFLFVFGGLGWRGGGVVRGFWVRRGCGCGCVLEKV